MNKYNLAEISFVSEIFIYIFARCKQNLLTLGVGKQNSVPKTWEGLFLAVMVITNFSGNLIIIL